VPVPRPLVAVLVAAVIAAAGCGGDGASARPSGTPLTVGLGYIPSVQFAPFYLADQQGFYADAGVQVTFQNRIDPDLITLVGQGAVDIGLGDGTSVIPAVSQGIPIRYVATIYGRFPSIVFAKASSGIADAADLDGRRLGIPGRYGSSWIMLQALLRSAGLAPDDLEIVEYPDFGQGVALAADQVDAATGFVNNEPVQLELGGEEATILAVDDVVPLPGNGLVAGSSTIESKRDAIQAFVTATLRAMDEIAADPEAGLEAAIAAVPELAESRDAQRAILEATIATWEPRDASLAYGDIERPAWEASIEFLDTLELIDEPVRVEDVVDVSFTGH
jgi:NitT/TauT family transport system substrate-binding protein